MIKINGIYYDGQSSARIPVTISFYRTGKVQISSETLVIKTSFDQLRIAARLANTRRNIFLNNGGKLETADNDAIDRVCAYFDSNIFQALLHRLEKHWGYVLTALLITLAFTWGGIEYGVPVAAKWVAKGIPIKIEQQLGEQTLASLDNWLLSKTKISAQDQTRLQQHIDRLVNTTGQQKPYRLIFRNSPQMGANALALPGGMVILTDDLVKLAKNDEQIISVIAHEMGHIQYQHGLRSILQDSITALFMAGLLGDITSITSLSVTLPTFLVETHYSRQFELEADQYAIQFLQQRNIDTEAFIQILTRLEQAHNSSFEFDYLSSHPAMEIRLDKIRSGRKNNSF